MIEYDKRCIKVFLENQTQIFGEGNQVVKTVRETREYLENVMAVIVNDSQEVCDYFIESGVDVSGMELEEVLAQNEVFDLQDGRYLIVES